MKKIIIIGAGPGGLSAAMQLSKDLDIEIYEKNDRVGGRNSNFTINDFTFDLGPTFLHIKGILEGIFKKRNRELSDYLELKKIEPLYDLHFFDKSLRMTGNRKEMAKRIEALFPGESKGYFEYVRRERIKAKRLMPCLQVPYDSPLSYLSKRFLKALPYLDAHKSLMKSMERYFNDERLRLAFTFQSKYIGMSPWEAPGTFSILSAIEHLGGIYHPIGGLNQVSNSMAKVLEEDGVKINLNCEVKEIIVEDNVAKGIILHNGEQIKADAVIINSDFAYSMNKLVDKKKRKKYTDKKLQKMRYSCSTYMLYLGIKGEIEQLQHHSIYLAKDYTRNIEEISNKRILSKDISFYIQNACRTDKTLCPDGHSTLYILVPVPNNKSYIDWDIEDESFKEHVLNTIVKRTGISDLKERIVVSRSITPKEWENNYNVYNGAVFNLGHNLTQMLYLRPHNEFEEFKDCFLVGGGTHPGSGLPTILESGKITANIINKKY